MLLLCFLIVASLPECCRPLTAETDVIVAGNLATSGTNSAAHQTGSSTPPSSSPPPSVSTLGPQAIPRRHAPADVIARQGSFRGFPALSQKTSPFKRQLSLRMNELPSTMQRKSDFPIKNTGEFGICPQLPYFHWTTITWTNSLRCILSFLLMQCCLLYLILLTLLWRFPSSPWGRRRRWQHQFAVHSDHLSLQWTPWGPLLLSTNAQTSFISTVSCSTR